MVTKLLIALSAALTAAIVVFFYHAIGAPEVVFVTKDGMWTGFAILLFFLTIGVFLGSLFVLAHGPSSQAEINKTWKECQQDAINRTGEELSFEEVVAINRQADEELKRWFDLGCPSGAVVKISNEELESVLLAARHEAQARRKLNHIERSELLRERAGF
jgi:hypothetical protein